MPTLSPKIVASTRPADSDVFVWCAGLRGFGLRVKPSGAASFVVQYRADGVSRRMTLGRAKGDGALSVKEAKALAVRTLAEVSRGGDPQADRTARRKAWTVADACEAYQEVAQAGLPVTRRGQAKSASTVAIDAGRIAHHILPTLGRVKLPALKRSDVQRLFEDVAAGRTATPAKKATGRRVARGGVGTAKKAVTTLAAILDFAVRRGAVQENVARGFVLPPDNRRSVDDPLPMLAALGKALDLAEAQGEPWQATVAFRLAALTGLRRQEAFGLRWSEVDFGRRVFRLEATKTGRSVRPMSEAARSLLATAPSYKDAGRGGYVFPGITGDRHFASYGRALARIVGNPGLSDEDRAALRGAHYHLLRHAFATVANEAGCTLPDIAGLLGHAAGGVTARYIGGAGAHLNREADRVARIIEAAMRGGNERELMDNIVSFGALPNG